MREQSTGVGMNRKADAMREGQAARVAALKAVLRATGGQAKVRELFQLLTAEEAAAFLALDVGTVRNLTYRKELPCVKVGPRGVRYRLLDLLAWIEDRSHPAREGPPRRARRDFPGSLTAEKL